MDLDVYSGKLEYRDIIFDYVFDGGTLRLIPPTELKSQLYYDWFMKKIGDGAYTMAEPPMMEEPYLIGKNNEDGRRMIFITATNSAIGSYNSVFIVKIVAVIKCRLERSGIDRISFSGPEISRIHPVEKAFSFLWKEPELENGVFTVKTNPFIETSTHKQRFTVDGVCVFVSFDISRSMNNKEKHTPLSLESSMMFEFQETDDYAFIYRLYRLAKEFIQYLCYRKDIVFTGIKISAPYDGGKHEHFANMLVIDESDQVDSVSIEKNRIIRRDRLAGVEGSILNDIAKGDIYLRHIPESYSSGRNIDAARFVMITAAFEWEYRRLFPGGEEKSEKRLKAETEAREIIQQWIDDKRGNKKLRDIFKNLKNHIGFSPLEKRIIHVGNEFENIVGDMGEYIYIINDEELRYNEMGKRLAGQRNNFAHGNLDKEFEGLALLDLIYLEVLVYAMQLRYYGIPRNEIRHSVNELFHLNQSV